MKHETHYHDQEGTSISWELEVTPSDKHGIYDLMTLRIFDYFLFDYDEHLHNPDDPKDISDYLTIYLKGAGRKDVGTVRIGKDFIEINRNFS